MPTKRTRSIKHKIVTNRLRIGGDERDKKPIWERLLAIVMEKLPLTGAWERTTEETIIEDIFESDSEEIVTVNEQAEAHLQKDAQKALEAEARTAERQSLISGLGDKPSTANPEDVADAMRNLAKEIRSMRDDGYEIKLRELDPGK